MKRQDRSFLVVAVLVFGLSAVSALVHVFDSPAGGSAGAPAGGHSHHGAREADPTRPPDLTLSVQRDSVTGFNLFARVKNFRFAPERAGSSHVDGEGHAHLYVDGEKVARLYGEWFHIAKLTEGQHEIEARLSSNDHSEITLRGKPVRASVSVVVP